jgi:hypothetical protein
MSLMEHVYPMYIEINCIIKWQSSEVLIGNQCKTNLH